MCVWGTEVERSEEQWRCERETDELKFSGLLTVQGKRESSEDLERKRRYELGQKKEDGISFEHATFKAPTGL